MGRGNVYVCCAILGIVTAGELSIETSADSYEAAGICDHYKCFSSTPFSLQILPSLTILYTYLFNHLSSIIYLQRHDIEADSKTVDVLFLHLPLFDPTLPEYGWIRPAARLQFVPRTKMCTCVFTILIKLDF